MTKGGAVTDRHSAVPSVCDVVRLRTTEIVAPSGGDAQLSRASDPLVGLKLWEAGGVSDRVKQGARDEFATPHSVASVAGTTLRVRVGVFEGTILFLGWNLGRGV